MRYNKHAPLFFFSQFETKHNHRKMDFGKHAQHMKPKSQQSAQRSVFCPEPLLGPRCPACQEEAQTKSMLSLSSSHCCEENGQVPAIPLHLLPNTQPNTDFTQQRTADLGFKSARQCCCYFFCRIHNKMSSRTSQNIIR